MGSSLKEHWVELVSLLAALAPGALSFAVADASSAWAERPVAMGLTAVCGVAVGALAAWHIPQVRDAVRQRREDRGAEASLRRSCAGMSDRQRAVMWEALDNGKVDAGLGDTEVGELVKAGLLAPPECGYSVVTGRADLSVPLEVAGLLHGGAEGYLGPRPGGRD